MTERERFSINLEEFKNLNVKLKNFKGGVPMRDRILRQRVLITVREIQRVIATEVLKDNISYRQIINLKKFKSVLNKRILIFMKDMVFSQVFRHLAIYNISRKWGSLVAGKDNQKFYSECSFFKNTFEYFNICNAWGTKQLKWKKIKFRSFISNGFVKDINDHFILKLIERTSFRNLVKYKCSSIRWVWISKVSGKLRLLGIPTIFDRVVQEMFRLVLAPCIESILEEHIYGFRIKRNAHNALGFLASFLNKTKCSYVYNVSLFSFFDTVRHAWILENFPMPFRTKHILQSWLVVGIFGRSPFKGIAYEDISQVGILSLLIINFTLNGLGSCVLNEVPNSLLIFGFNRVLDVKTFFISYLDKFIIITNYERYFNYYIQNVYLFLKKRGLKINYEKTQVVKFHEDIQVIKFSFLGYDFIKVWQLFKNFIKFKQVFGIHLVVVVQSDKIIKFKRRIKGLFNDKQNKTLYALIITFNFLFCEWCIYFDLGNCVNVLNSLDRYVRRRFYYWLRYKFRQLSFSVINQKRVLINLQRSMRVFNVYAIESRIKFLYLRKSFLVNKSWCFYKEFGVLINLSILVRKWLVVLSRVHQRIPVTLANLPFNIRESNPYIDESLFNISILKLIKVRARSILSYNKLV